jgi:4-diphosphocytidyl-2-C-methyl-D-erythritol kinase
LRWRSFAKINLHLQVVEKRPDGYHELLTVFQTIDLHDVLTLTEAPRDEIDLTVTGADLDPGPDNLAFRAAALFRNRFGLRRGVAIALEKRIPMGAGLGGGSSNAATVLMALRQREGKPDAITDLVALARELGADVPYFLVGGTALGTGRGDEVGPLPELPEEPILLALPGIHLSTAVVFAAARPSVAPTPPRIAALLHGEAPPNLASLDGRNDLEPAATALAPELRRVPSLLTAAGATQAFMTGSGSCFVGVSPPGASRSEGRSEGTAIAAARTIGRRSIAALRAP